MQESGSGTCEFIGWALLDLDDPIPNRANHVAQRLGVQVEDFIQQAIAEKLARMGEPEMHTGD